MDNHQIADILQKEAAMAAVWKEIFKLLECPVCSKKFDNNVNFCITGHSLCNECVQSLSVPECPICSATIILGSKNFAVNEATEQLKEIEQINPNFVDEPSNASKIVDIFHAGIDKVREDFCQFYYQD